MPFSMSARNALISFQYRQRYQEGYNCITSKYTLSEKAVSIPTTVSGGLQFLQDSLLTEAGKTFQYRQRYQEGYNTVPLSPWGYWPQMSKMENLIDFPTFSSLRQQALFAFCVATTSETLVLQGLAVFGKKSENLRPFGRSKRFSIFR